MMSREKYYLGISLGFNSSVSLVGTNSGVLCAISQERLNRQKNTKELPLDAIFACISTGEERLGKPIVIEKIVYSHYEDLSEAYLLKNVPEKFKNTMENFFKLAKNISDDKLEQAEWAFGRFLSAVIELGFGRRVIDDVLYRVEHHTAHAYSCIPVYSNVLIDWNDSFKFDQVFSLTADGFGDGYSGRISKWKSLKKQETISQLRVIDSPALIYQFFTGALQFKEHQHEGKVTGLAAHSEKSPEKSMQIYRDLLLALTGKPELGEPKEFCKVENIGGKDYSYGTCGLWVNEKHLLPLTELQKEAVKTSTIVDFERFLRLKNTVYKFVQDRLGTHYNKDDILGMLQGKIAIPEDMIYTPWELAYAVQCLAEDCIINWLKILEPSLKNDETVALMMAGGLVANVKLNQHVKDCGLFDSIFVSPPMGDEGTALGSVISYLIQNDKLFCISDSENFRYGPDIIINGGTQILNYRKFDLEDIIKSASKENSLKIIYYRDKSKLIDKVTDLLANNQIVHWCQGYEEFGPRALMNHSTLYTAEDPNGTHTLNQAMGRSEYMPYCPVCKNTSADELFENWKVGEESCRFMAMTMNCKPGVAEKYRGGVHVDNTARAQFVYKADAFTKDAWDILTSYEKKTGNKMLINTSFNIHNTPTCNLARDCWDAWIKSGRVGAALVLGNYIFINQDQ